MARVRHLANSLSCQESYFQKFNRDRAVKGGFGSIIAYLLHSACRNSVDLFDLPEIFRPCSEKHGIDYSRVLVDNESYHHPGGGELYESLGICAQGCMVLLRPDQHVSFLSDLQDLDGLERFLASFTRLG